MFSIVKQELLREKACVSSSLEKRRPTTQASTHYTTSYIIGQYYNEVLPSAHHHPPVDFAMGHHHIIKMRERHHVMRKLILSQVDTSTAASNWAAPHPAIRTPLHQMRTATCRPLWTLGNG